MLRYLYSVLFYLALPFFFLRLLWRSRQCPAYRQRLSERLGFCPLQLKSCIWVHAVSVGETLAAISLINALKTKYPNVPLLVTNMTVTGSLRVKAAFGEAVFNVYIPYDLPDAMHRFLKRVNPVVAVIMETELWPNLFAACKQKNIPIVVTNARLSEKSMRGYQRIAPLTQQMLSAVQALSVQSAIEADRFVALGLPRERIKVTGNLKFDMELPADLSVKSDALRHQLGRDRLIWIAASTHPLEEEIILSAHRMIQQQMPGALLMLVPRHPNRFDAVAKLVESQGFNLVRRSQKSSCDEKTEVFLGDTMGEMLLMYSVCDVAFVAGSFVAVGGHNILEPALLHKPIITGPSLFNFSEISEMLLNAKGMMTVNNADELAQKIIVLFSDTNARHQVGENAYQVVEKNRGALQRQVDVIVDIL